VIVAIPPFFVRGISSAQKFQGMTKKRHPVFLRPIVQQNIEIPDDLAASARTPGGAFATDYQP